MAFVMVALDVDTFMLLLAADEAALRVSIVERVDSS